MAGASFTTSIPLDLYASLMAEVKSTGESRNAVVVRALRSELQDSLGTRPTVVDSTGKGRPVANGAVSAGGRGVEPEDEAVAPSESSACPDCGGDIVETDDGRFCSDCHARVS